MENIGEFGKWKIRESRDGLPVSYYAKGEPGSRAEDWILRVFEEARDGSTRQVWRNEVQWPQGSGKRGRRSWIYPRTMATDNLEEAQGTVLEGWEKALEVYLTRSDCCKDCKEGKDESGDNET